MKKTILLGIVGVLLFSTSLLAGDSDIKMVTLKIEHMTCSDCSAKIKKQMESVCQEFMLDIKKGEGMCHYKTPVTEEQVLKEAKKAGFPVEIKK